MNKNDMKLREIAILQKMLEVLVMVGSDRFWRPMKNPDLYFRITALKIIGKILI